MFLTVTFFPVLQYLTLKKGNSVSDKLSSSFHQHPHTSSPLRPCNSWKKQNRHSLDATATKAFHPYTGLPLLSSPVRSSQADALTSFSPTFALLMFVIRRLDYLLVGFITFESLSKQLVNVHTGTRANSAG